MGMMILPLTDDDGLDVVCVWGQLMSDAKAKRFKSKNGKPLNKTTLYIRWGAKDEEVVFADCWYTIGNIVSTGKKFDYFIGIGVMREDTYNEQTEIRFSTGSMSQKYGFAMIAKDPRAFHGGTFKEEENPTESFTDIKPEDVPF